ncbi:MAG: tRNA uridine-5-carboxymethylaminomethyl(34) synthesis GTPase MnmE [Bdellovibrionales bacterium]|nr:tRNA uridine-5-carboxymethylaminomethyl(34) synthesis GTPase MnmE [Bdellovibrionales bacterium]
MSVYLDNESDTICATATPPGHGGIAVIRISGDDAIQSAKKCCPFLPSNPESHRVYYGFLVDKNNEKIDEVLCTYFASGRSFTGEPVVEISCHGGEYLTQAVLSRVVETGVRIAEKGEFSFRAFMNGRIDLVQAESILSLIQSETKKASQLSLSHLEGELSKTYKNIEDQLVWILAHLEANIDYAQEDIQVAEESLLLNKLISAESEIIKLVESFDDGRRVKEGVRISLIGLPNAGKSSLLNAILKQERSIVTDIEGTTRDFIEETYYYKNQKYILTDTAGLRETSDTIESLGIQRTINVVNQSDFIVVLLDPNQSIENQVENLKRFNIQSSMNTLYVVNKKDLITNTHLKSLKSFLPEKDRVLYISAKLNQGVDELLELIFQKTSPRSSESSALVTQLRHFELLKASLEDIDRAKQSLSAADSPEFTIFELQSSVYKIQEILGKQFDDEIMDRVFKEFCLGK